MGKWISVAVATLLLAACQTSSFNKYKYVSPEASFLDVNYFKDEGINPSVRRKHSHCVFEELWSWDGGELAAFKAAPGCYMKKSASRTDILEKDFVLWRYLESIDLKLVSGSVTKENDAHGRSFVYGLGQSDKDGKTCFVGSRGVGWEQSEEGANILMYFCRNSDSYNQQQVAETGQRILASIFMR